MWWLAIIAAAVFGGPTATPVAVPAPPPKGPCTYGGPKLGFTIPTRAESPDLTDKEHAAVVYVLSSMNARLAGIPWVNPWGMCGPEDVAKVATVPLDELGVLAMQIYWRGTKSGKARPWPTEDLEVLEAQDVTNPFDPQAPKLPLAEYLVWRIKYYKTFLNNHLSANLA